MSDDAARLERHILGQGERVFEIQRALTAIPALGPENGGQGEAAKAELVCQWLAGMAGVRRFDSPDPRVESGKRPNIVAVLEGKRPEKLWLFGHLDVVPPGDAAAWNSDPWQVLRDGDLLFGRGVEDNQQAVASMLILAESLHALKIRPELGLGLVFMADEECGSAHGLAYLLEKAPDLFNPSDFFIVPDGGSPNGQDIEIAEKAQLWLRFEVLGRQCHASTPHKGKNAFVAASRLVAALAELESIFGETSPLFDRAPAGSTFVPTKHEANVPGVNILPGRDVFFMDCRLLPGTATAAVLGEVKRIAGAVAKAAGVEIGVEAVHCRQATATPPDTPVMGPLAEAIATVYGVESRPVGIGGATVAAFLRDRGLPAVVWSCIRNTCHQPNECSSISATCRDAAVFGHILTPRAEAGGNG